MRHYVPKFLLRTIYFSIFNSLLIYTCQIWGQKENTVKKLSEIQDKAIRIISFKDQNYPTNELCYYNKILKIADYIKLLNCLFVKSILSNNHLPIFENIVKISMCIFCFILNLSFKFRERLGKFYICLEICSITLRFCSLMDLFCI